MLRSNRYVSAGIEAGKVTAQHTAKAARSLWYQVTGFIFSVIAVIGVIAAWREYSSGAENWRIGLTIVFALMFGYFGASAFIRSRR